MKMKIMKATIRRSQIVGALVPGADLPIGIAAAVAKIGIRLTVTKICYWTAAELHWRAFAERRINKNAVGPAGRIITELFTRRGPPASSASTTWTRSSTSRAAGWPSPTRSA